MGSASRVETLLTCAKAQERRAMLPDGFSVGYFRLSTRLHLHEHIGLCFLMMKDGEDSAAGLYSVRIWRSQVQKLVLNAADGLCSG